jgi:hypothetical protein
VIDADAEVGGVAEDAEETVGAVMARVLSERLEGARPSLRKRAIDGDGHCAFRSVACQDVRYGHDGHRKLRHAAVAYVESHRAVYVGFVGSMEQLAGTSVVAQCGRQW